MEKLTREQAITEHRKMWNWIAEQIEHSTCVKDIERLKDKYVTDNGFYLENDCFLCEYSKQNINLSNCGKSCILKWKNNYCSMSEYMECSETNMRQEQHTLALKIANLEERKFEYEN